MHITKNQISIAGEFAVLSRLAVEGYDASLTLGNTKNVDILVSAPAGEMYRVEVKTRRNAKVHNSEIFGRHYSWQLSKKHEDIIDPKLFYCFVNLNLKTKDLRFFIVPSKIVARYVKKENQIWLKRNPQNKKTNMRQFRLGFKGEKYTEIPDTPLIDDWEDNWDFLSTTPIS